MLIGILLLVIFMNGCIVNQRGQAIEEGTLQHYEKMLGYRTDSLFVYVNEKEYQNITASLKDEDFRKYLEEDLNSIAITSEVIDSISIESTYPEEQFFYIKIGYVGNLSYSEMDSTLKELKSDLENQWYVKEVVKEKWEGVIQDET